MSDTGSPEPLVLNKQYIFYIDNPQFHVLHIFSQKLQIWLRPKCTRMFFGWSFMKFCIFCLLIWNPRWFLPHDKVYNKTKWQKCFKIILLWCHSITWKQTLSGLSIFVQCTSTSQFTGGTFLLNFEQLSWISYTTLFEIRRLQIPF